MGDFRPSGWRRSGLNESHCRRRCRRLYHHGPCCGEDSSPSQRHRLSNQWYWCTGMQHCLDADKRPWFLPLPSRGVQPTPVTHHTQQWSPQHGFRNDKFLKVVCAWNATFSQNIWSLSVSFLVLCLVSLLKKNSRERWENQFVSCYRYFSMQNDFLWNFLTKTKHQKGCFVESISGFWKVNARKFPFWKKKLKKKNQLSLVSIESDRGKNLLAHWGQYGFWNWDLIENSSINGNTCSLGNGAHKTAHCHAMGVSPNMYRWLPLSSNNYTN